MTNLARMMHSKTNKMKEGNKNSNMRSRRSKKNKNDGFGCFLYSCENITFKYEHIQHQG